MKRGSSLPQDPFELKDDRLFLVHLESAILRAACCTNVVEGIGSLNEHERHFVAVFIFMVTCDADGVGHFFYYEEGDLYGHVLKGLGAIRAHDARARLECYVRAVFGEQVPSNSPERRGVLDESSIEPEADSSFGDCTDVNDLLIAWARENREHFRLGSTNAI